MTSGGGGPSLEDVFAVISAALFGQDDARVQLPDQPDQEHAPTKLAIALNVLLDDLAARARTAEQLTDRLRTLAATDRSLSAATDPKRLLIERLPAVVAGACTIEPGDGPVVIERHRLSIPLTHRAECFGRVVLTRDADAEPFDDNDVDLATALTAHAAIAIANARAFTRYTMLTESGLIGIAVGTPNRLLLEVNDAFLNLVGFTRPEFEAGAMTDHRMTPDDWKHVLPPVAEQLQTLGIAAPWEQEILRKDGSRVPVFVGMRRLDHEMLIAFFVDLSERKQAEATIATLERERAAEAQFRALLEAAPDAMIIVDDKGCITLVNAQVEQLFGYAREELMGKPIELLVPERFRERHPQYLKDYFKAPKVRAMAGTSVNLAGRRKDGTEFAAEVSLGPIETPEGTLATATIRDITERKLHEARVAKLKSQVLEEENRRMQDANRLKSEFLANMSHELRTPLNAIIGFSELMHRGKVGPVSAEHAEYLGDILNSSRHLLRLINDILDLAKVESGKMEFQPEVVDLTKVVAEVRDILRGLAATKHIRIDVTVDPSLGPATIDPSKLKQVLYNYLSNALKFTPDEGTISVRLTPEKDQFFRLEVEDTGIGIRPEEINRLFVEFQQLDAGAAKKYAGTGLGLALTKRICEAQGGHVEVRSVPGKGSVFSAVLPMVPRAPDSKPRA